MQGIEHAAKAEINLIPLREDEARFPVEVSASFFDIEVNKFLQAIIRDIAEPEKMKEALRSPFYGANCRLQCQPGATRDFYIGACRLFFGDCGAK